RESQFAKQAWKDCSSYPCVPGISTFGGNGAQALAELLYIVGDNQAVEELHALIAKLPRKFHTQWTAAAYWQIIPVYSEGEKCLRMERIGHIHAFPPVGFDRKIENILGLRVCADEVQNVGKRDAVPLGDVGPSFFAHRLGDLAFGWIALQLVDRECHGMCHHPVDREPPIHKFCSHVTLEFFTEW